MSTAKQKTELSGRVALRRVTPTEVERLQGFPDGHTAWGIGSDGKRIEMSDTSRYRQLGNAVTVTVAERIARRIREALAQGDT